MHYILRKSGIRYLTVCILSKFVEIQMINRISKKITPAHTCPESRWPTGFYWGDLRRRMCRLRSQSRRHWQSQTEQLKGRSPVCIVHTGERHLSYSVCDYQCRRDCDFIPSNDTFVVISCPSRIQQVSQLHTLVNDLSQLYRAYATTLLAYLGSVVVKRPLQSLHWDNCLLELGSWRRMCILVCRLARCPFWKVRDRFTHMLYLQLSSVVVYYGTV